MIYFFYRTAIDGNSLMTKKNKDEKSIFINAQFKASTP